MKILFAFYLPVTEWVSICSDFSGLDFVFAENINALSEEIEDTDALFILAPRYTPDVALVVRKKAKKLKWIQATTVGVDEIIINGIPSGVILTKAVGIFDTNVAEHVMALLLAMIRQVAASERDKQNYMYNRELRWEQTASLERKKVGIVGYGGIGKQVSKRVKAFDSHILVYDVAAGLADSNVDEFFLPGQFEEFLGQCDVVILTLPLTKNTLYMFDQTAFSHMKKNSLLINVSRGKLVKESALVEALRNKMIAGAGLDVYEEEPLPSTSELWKLDNCVMTPHLGGQGDYNRLRLADLFRVNIDKFLNQQELLYTVDVSKGF